MIVMGSDNETLMGNCGVGVLRIMKGRSWLKEEEEKGRKGKGRDGKRSDGKRKERMGR